MIKYAACGTLVFVALAGAARADELVPEPEGYRTEDYRAPVPDTLAGARVLSTAEAESIWHAKSGIFVDVLPRPPKPSNLPAGTVWRDKPRFNIPASGSQMLAFGYRTRDMASWPSQWKITFGWDYFAPQVTIAQLRSSSIARPIAGCPGTLPNAHCPMAIPMSPGTPTERTAGSEQICRRSRRSRNHGRVNRTKYGVGKPGMG
jgi:hypothetical protein